MRMIEIQVTEAVWQWLKDESHDDGIGFTRVSSGREDLPLLVLVSEDTADAIATKYSMMTDCSFDEPDWQFNAALEMMILEAAASSVKLN